MLHEWMYIQTKQGWGKKIICEFIVYRTLTAGWDYLSSHLY